MVNPEKLSHLTDEELVKLSLKNQENFLFLIKRYEGKLFKYIMRISNFSKEEAEDVLQDLFIKVYQNLNEFDPKLKFSSWIYRITHNQVISQFRKNKARPQGIQLDPEIDLIENLASDLNMPEEVDRELLKENLETVFNKLSLKYREVLILNFFEEKSYKEISDIIKKPTGTVATLLNRAKKQFKEILARDNIKL